MNIFSARSVISISAVSGILLHVRKIFNPEPGIFTNADISDTADI